MAPPPPRPALGALFLVLAIAFAGIAAAAVEAVDDEPGLVVVVVAAGVDRALAPDTRRSKSQETAALGRIL